MFLKIKFTKKYVNSCIGKKKLKIIIMQSNQFYNIVLFRYHLEENTPVNVEISENTDKHL